MKITNAKSRREEIEDSIFINGIGTDFFQMLSANPKAIVFSDLRINKKAIEQMRDKEIILCIQTSNISNSADLQRSKILYMTSKLFDYARSMKLDISFASFARREHELCSYMQMLELAKLIGANEEYARRSISEVNKSLMIK
ncbi:MAG: hypothetical protein ABR981_03515 [Candidatus Micrarchaeaceae archaeon]